MQLSWSEKCGIDCAGLEILTLAPNFHDIPPPTLSGVAHAI